MSHIINRSKNGQNPIFSRKLENSHSSPHFYRKKLKIRLLTKKWHFWTFWLILADFLKILGRGSPLVPTSVVDLFKYFLECTLTGHIWTILVPRGLYIFLLVSSVSGQFQEARVKSTRTTPLKIFYAKLDMFWNPRKTVQSDS